MSFIKREQQIRRRVKAIFNKEESDFESKELWDDYLETSEDIIFNLCEETAVQANESKLREYAKENQSVIAAVAARKAEQLRKKPDKAASLPEPIVQQESGYAAAPRLLPPKPQEVPRLLEPAPNAGPLDASAWSDMAAASGWKSSFVIRRLHQAAFGACNLLPHPVTTS